VTEAPPPEEQTASPASPAPAGSPAGLVEDQQAEFEHQAEALFSGIELNGRTLVRKARCNVLT